MVLEDSLCHALATRSSRGGPVDSLKRERQLGDTDPDTRSSGSEKGKPTNSSTGLFIFHRAHNSQYKLC